MRLRTKVIIPLVIGSIALFIASLAGVTTLFVTSNAAVREPVPSYEEVSYSELINRTKGLPEVKAFLDRYPTAWVFVMRSGSDFSVHHQITQSDLTGRLSEKEVQVEYVQPYLSLNVGLDGKGYPDRTVLWCTTDEHGQFKIEIPSENELIEHLDKEICTLA